MSFLISEFGQYKSYELPDFNKYRVKNSHKIEPIDHQKDESFSRHLPSNAKATTKNAKDAFKQYNKQETNFKHYHQTRLAKEIMSKNVKTISINQEVSDIKNLMLKESISHIPILDKEMVVGLITAEDILFKTGKIKDIMVRNIIVTLETTLITDLAKIMYAENIGCLPVLNEKKIMTGIITQKDILHFLAQKSLF